MWNEFTIKEEKKGKEIILKVDQEEPEESQKDQVSSDDVSTDVNKVESQLTDELKEEEEKEEHPATPWIQELISGTKDFILNLVYPSGVGVDYYSIMFFCEFVTFVFLLLFQRDFTGVESQDVVGVHKIYVILHTYT